MAKRKNKRDLINADSLKPLGEPEVKIVPKEQIDPRQVELDKWERMVERGVKAFFDIGRALREIRDQELYLLSHPNFDDYCQERWGFKRAHAYRFIEASLVMDNMRQLPGLQDLPKNEAQVRPLTRLPAEEQPRVWQEIVQESQREGKPLTASLVAKVVKQHTAQTKQQPTAQGHAPYTPLGEGYREQLRRRAAAAPLPQAVLVTYQWLKDNDMVAIYAFLRNLEEPPTEGYSEWLPLKDAKQMGLLGK